MTLRTLYQSFGALPRWHEVPLPPLEGELLSAAKLRGFLAQLTHKPLRLTFVRHLPFPGEARVLRTGGRSVAPLKNAFSDRCRFRGNFLYNQPGAGGIEEPDFFFRHRDVNHL